MLVIDVFLALHPLVASVPVLVADHRVERSQVPLLGLQRIRFIRRGFYREHRVEQGEVVFVNRFARLATRIHLVFGYFAVKNRAAALERKALVATLQICALAERESTKFGMIALIQNIRVLIIIILPLLDYPGSVEHPLHILVEVRLAFNETASVLVGSVTINLLAQNFRIGIAELYLFDAVSSCASGFPFSVPAAETVLPHYKGDVPSRRVSDSQKGFGRLVIGEDFRLVDVPDGKRCIAGQRGIVVVAVQGTLYDASVHEAVNTASTLGLDFLPDDTRFSTDVFIQLFITPVVGRVQVAAADKIRVVERIKLVSRAY